MHSLAIREDGSVAAWGWNQHGQTNVPVGLSGVTAVSGGFFHSAALKNDGTVTCWGHFESFDTPQPANLQNVTAIASGGFHVLALKADGSVVGWGNWFNDRITIPASLGKAKAIAAGQYHSLALQEGGTVVGWGQNGSGQATPPAGLGNVKSISAGAFHSLALKEDGTVVGWGSNEWGQATPPSDLGNVKAVAAGELVSLALKEDGTLVAWGYQGQPTYVPPTELGNVSAIAASNLHSLAIYNPLPPLANAGADRSVNQAEVVSLNGAASSHPFGSALTYSWRQVGVSALSPSVSLAGVTTATPTFTAPNVQTGGATLTFELTVTAHGFATGLSSVDTVNINIVNVNYPPVAQAGDDKAAAEFSHVMLHGSDSYDLNGDVLAFSWRQTAGVTVDLIQGSYPGTVTFTAPEVPGGNPESIQTLEFELSVDDSLDDGIPPVTDTVLIEITNVNTIPVADAGPDQTVAENGSVSLTGDASSDPDGDLLSYTWVQVSGPPVDLVGPKPSFIAPFVAAGGADLEFDLTVNDGYGGSSIDRMVVHVQNINDPPLASAAQPTTSVLWPPAHGLIAVGITGVSDPNSNATITITGVTQDEPTNGQGDGDTGPDAVINDDGTVLLRAERSGNGDGRVYVIQFTASDLEGVVFGAVKVIVPKSKRTAGALQSPDTFDSTQ
jgi:hypothetical protein